MTFFGIFPGEVEQRADDLLDLEARLLDQLEPFVCLRIGVGFLDQELGQAEDGEQRVVDLVRDAGGQFADRGQLPALDELLVEAALLGHVVDDTEQQHRFALVTVDRMREHLDGQRPAVLAPVDLTDDGARLEGGQRLLVGLPPGKRRREADDRVELVADQIQKRLVRRDERACRGVCDRQGDRNRIEERVEIPLVQHFALVLGGDVSEDDHSAAGRRGDASVEDELPAVECRCPDPEAAAGTGRDRLLAGDVPLRMLVGLPVQVAGVEQRGSELHAEGNRQEGARGRIRSGGCRRADDDAVGDSVEHRVELELLTFPQRALGDRGQPGERPQEAGGRLCLVLRERLGPERMKGGDPVRGDERHADDERRRLERAGQARREALDPGLPGIYGRAPDGLCRAGRRGDCLAEGEPGVGPDRAEAQVVVPGDDGKSVAAEERQTGLRQDLKRLVEGRRFIDGDGSLDQLALVRDPGPGRPRRHALDACAHRFRIETCMTTIGIGLRNRYP